MLLVSSCRSSASSHDEGIRLTQGWGDGVVIEQSATIEIRRVVGESAKIVHVSWATYHVRHAHAVKTEMEVCPQPIALTCWTKV